VVQKLIGESHGECLHFGLGLGILRSEKVGEADAQLDLFSVAQGGERLGYAEQALDALLSASLGKGKQVDLPRLGVEGFALARHLPDAPIGVADLDERFPPSGSHRRAIRVAPYLNGSGDVSRGQRLFDLVNGTFPECLGSEAGK
jgi:hypothetical protein